MDPSLEVYEIFKLHKYNFKWSIPYADSSFTNYKFISSRFPNAVGGDGWTVEFETSCYPVYLHYDTDDEEPSKKGGLFSEIIIYFKDKSYEVITTGKISFVFSTSNPKAEFNSRSYDLDRLSEKVKLDKHLNIEIDMTVRKFDHSSASVLAIDPRSTLSYDLGHAFEKSEFSDVTFSVGESEFRAHKCILSARSEVFAAMFTTQMKESEKNLVEIEDIEPNVFKELIRFIYSEKANVEEFALELLKAAEKYNVPTLKTVCEQILIGRLNASNCIELLIEGNLYSKRLKERAIKIIVEERKTSMSSGEWIALKKDHRDLADEVYDYALGLLETQ